MLHHAVRRSARDEKFIHREPSVWRCDSACSRRERIFAAWISAWTLNSIHWILVFSEYYSVIAPWKSSLIAWYSQVSNVFKRTSSNERLFKIYLYILLIFPFSNMPSTVCGPIEWFKSIADKQLVSTCEWLDDLIVPFGYKKLLDQLVQLIVLAFS